MPASTDHTLMVNVGDGGPCDGCGEPVAPPDDRYTVTVVPWLEWRFPEDRYNAWANFERHNPDIAGVD